MPCITAKFIRISDRLYDSAVSHAALMHRSLAQQNEHWATLGHAFESSAATSDVLAAAVRHMHIVDTDRVKSGQLHAIPADLARKSRVDIHRKALEDFDVGR